ELGLGGGTVAVRRAIALAARARQTQVQGVTHFGGATSVLGGRIRVRAAHFERQPRPASGGVLFFPGHHGGRTPHPALLAAAVADADASHGGPREAAVVGGGLAGG